MNKGSDDPDGSRSLAINVNHMGGERFLSMMQDQMPAIAFSGKQNGYNVRKHFT